MCGRSVRHRTRIAVLFHPFALHQLARRGVRDFGRKCTTNAPPMHHQSTAVFTPQTSHLRWSIHAESMGFNFAGKAITAHIRGAVFWRLFLGCRFLAAVFLAAVFGLLSPLRAHRALAARPRRCLGKTCQHLSRRAGPCRSGFDMAKWPRRVSRRTRRAARLKKPHCGAQSGANANISSNTTLAAPSKAGRIHGSFFVDPHLPSRRLGLKESGHCLKGAA